MLESMINALALTNERYVYYLDLDSMTVVKNRSTIDDMDVSYLAHAYPDRFLPLPNKKELHTYAIMEEYAKRASAGRREKLLTALKGDRPFIVSRMQQRSWNWRKTGSVTGMPGSWISP